MKKSGQALPSVIALLLIGTILLAAMVYYVQKEAIWSVNQANSTTAFQLAEAGAEKGYLAMTVSTTVWQNLQNGTLISGFNFDTAYTDFKGGEYAVSVTSGPLQQEATIISVGRVGGTSPMNEIRAVKVVYANVLSGNNAVVGGAVDESGNNMTVEWGAVMSESSMTVNTSNLHPQLWSVGSMINVDTDPNAAKCDSPHCWWWHAYQTNLPPFPSLDFNGYQNAAIAAGASPCGGSYYTNGSRSGTCNDTSGNTYYVTGNWTSFNGPIKGNVIVLGSLTTPNGAMSSQNINAAMPQQAWEQYCNDWSYYLTNYNDAYAQSHYPSSCPGLNSGYLSVSTITASISPVIQGLLYVGGNFTGPTGGGNTDLIYGLIIVKGSVFLNSNSHVKVWYNGAAASTLKATNVILTRQSWQDTLQSWPSGLP